MQKSSESPMMTGNLLRDAALSYENLFFETKTMQYLITSIEYLKKSLESNTDNPLAYHDLTVAYYYDSKKDSAKKYLDFADKYDSTLIPPELREIINK